MLNLTTILCSRGQFFIFVRCDRRFLEVFLCWNRYHCHCVPHNAESKKEWPYALHFPNNSRCQGLCLERMYWKPGRHCLPGGQGGGGGGIFTRFGQPTSLITCAKVQMDPSNGSNLHITLYQGRKSTLSKHILGNCG